MTLLCGPLYLDMLFVQSVETIGAITDVSTNGRLMPKLISAAITSNCAHTLEPFKRNDK